MRRFAAVSFILTIGWAIGVGQSNQPASSVLSLDEVVKLTKAGLSEEIIVAKIKKAGRAFDLGAEEILELRRVGVSDAVIKVLVDPTQPYTPPPAPVQPGIPSSVPAPTGPSVPAPKPPSDPIAYEIPGEPGVYYRSDPASPRFAKLELKTLTAAKASTKLTKMLKRGVEGYLAGSSARTSTRGPKADLYIRLPEKTNVEELALLEMEAKSDRRVIDFGPNPYRPVFPVDALKQYSASEIDVHLYRIHCEDLIAGEYLIFLLGSGDEKKGILGKGYDFKVEK